MKPSRRHGIRHNRPFSATPAPPNQPAQLSAPSVRPVVQRASTLPGATPPHAALSTPKKTGPRPGQNSPNSRRLSSPRPAVRISCISSSTPPSASAFQTNRAPEACRRRRCLKGPPPFSLRASVLGTSRQKNHHVRKALQSVNGDNRRKLHDQRRQAHPNHARKHHAIIVRYARVGHMICRRNKQHIKKQMSKRRLRLACLRLPGPADFANSETTLFHLI